MATTSEAKRFAHGDYASYSYWLETASDDLTPRPRLDGSLDVDVAVLGAGYTGLWTAYYLLAKEPSLRIAILEREIAGFGASGRNGGWCSAGFPVTLAGLRDRFGPDAARAVARAMQGAVAEVGRVAAAEGIDAQFHQGGSLRLARGAHQLAAIEGAFRTAEALGLADGYRLLSAAETAERVRITDAVGALFSPTGAGIHPGRLVRGLARAVERQGATIYERTPVMDFVPGSTGSRPRFLTPYGEVTATTLVLAGEAYLTQLPKLRRSLIPVYSLIVLTEPLSAAQWAPIGWQGRELVASSRYSVDYLNHTADGRILFGGRGAPYRLGSLIADPLDRHEATHAMLRRMLVEWFPTLRDLKITHAWGGPLGMPRDWMPTTSYDASAGIASARGYTGQGVATANLFGRVLADLITGTVSPLTFLPTVNHRSPRWEPEPLRWGGIRFVQEGYRRIDERAERTGIAPTGSSLVERLGAH